MRKNYKTLLLVLLTAAFVAGLIQLITLRFAAGDIYPPYSSLRSDPLGTKALFAGIGDLKNVNVKRNYAPENRITDAAGSTFFYFGLQPLLLNHLPQSDIEALEKLAREGGRLVITLLPGTDASVKAAENKDEPEENAKKEKMKEQKGEKPVLGQSLGIRWQFSLGTAAENRRAWTAWRTLASPELLPDDVPWHSAHYFSEIGADWMAVYTVNDRPVVIERKYGAGTIVLATDSYFVSNEAMFKNRHPALLAWLIGSNKKIIFDETHLGIHEDPGIASLFRKYHLHGVFVAIIVLGILFIWKNSTSLVPPPAYDKTEKHDAPAAGRDYLAGLVNMLRRTVKREALLSICLAEWEKTARFNRRNQDKKREKIKKFLQSRQEKPVKDSDLIAAYSETSKILAEREYT